MNIFEILLCIVGIGLIIIAFLMRKSLLGKKASISIKDYLSLQSDRMTVLLVLGTLCVGGTFFYHQKNYENQLEKLNHNIDSIMIKNAQLSNEFLDKLSLMKFGLTLGMAFPDSDGIDVSKMTIKVLKINSKPNKEIPFTLTNGFGGNTIRMNDVVTDEVIQISAVDTTNYVKYVSEQIVIPSPTIQMKKK
jgi:hypothetical protein